MMSESPVQEIICDDIQAEVERRKADGFRLHMIFPADNPRTALMSRGRESVSLSTPVKGIEDRRQGNSLTEWVRGRAGMEYRDMIPDRLEGKAILSHIRLTDGGEVSDYVHYHKIEFQMIYCIRGRIKVAYEDQGEPFWIEAGDSVLQPPEIRHQVLECTPGAEVLELTLPAEHETWVDHEMTLPNGKIDRERKFSGQQFVFTKGGGHGN